MQKKKIGNSEELYGELGEAFNFTKGDLEANRAGFLSFRQKQQQRNGLVATLMIALFLIIIILVIVTVFTFVTAIKNGECTPLLCDGMASDGRIKIFMAQLACTSPLWIFLLWAFFAHKKDMRTGRIEKLVSKLGVDKVVGKTISYYLVSSEHRFSISEADYNYNWGEVPYTLYFLPFTKTILSIEAMGQAETKGKKVPGPDVPFGEYGRVFKFTENDLEANRAGFVSEAQKNTFVGDELGSVMALVMGGIIVFASCIYILINFILFAWSGFDTTNSIQFAEFMASLCSSVFIVVFGAIAFRGYRTGKQAELNSKETLVQVYDGYEKYRQNSNVTLSDEQQKLIERYPVRIYAMPTTKKILSVHILLPEQE